MTLLTPPPPIPNRNDPATFPDRADAFVAWFATVVDDINEIPGLYARTNILGPVSQVGGVPQGAIMDSGSNSNGRFIKYADGTMICYRSAGGFGNVNTALGTGFRSPKYTWTFPQAFATDPTSITSVGRNVDDDVILFSGQTVVSTTSVIWYVLSLFSSSVTTVRANQLAIGRWF